MVCFFLHPFISIKDWPINQCRNKAQSAYCNIDETVSLQLLPFSGMMAHSSTKALVCHLVDFQHLACMMYKPSDTDILMRVPTFFGQ